MSESVDRRAVTLSDCYGETKEPKLGELLCKHETGTFAVGTTPLFIGREADNDVLLSAPKASRHHGVIYRYGDSYLVRDLHSRNGVALNGEQVDIAPIHEGDRLHFSRERIDVKPGRAWAQPYRRQALILDATIAHFEELRGQYREPLIERLREIHGRLEDHALLARGCPLRREDRGLVVAFGLWNIPDRRYSPADAALGFAREARALLQEEIYAFTREADSCDLRVGISLGDVCYEVQGGLAASGESVELATQLRELNQLYGTKILMSRACCEALRNPAHVREIDTVRVSGVPHPVALFAFDDRSHIRQVATTSVTDEKAIAAPQKYLDMYARALAAYRGGEFAEAYQGFEEIYAVYRDRPSRTMRKRILEMLRTDASSGEGWDGVWDVTE